ncbi:hypothetical protein VNO77_15570 [Canavalia gladiata]|uniref:Uncharacterized protein n=1 Tax=Canavalia gladiata TaxID=3824 RepID=A0AAN9LZ65_CANGL
MRCLHARENELNWFGTHWRELFKANAIYIPVHIGWVDEMKVVKNALALVVPAIVIYYTAPGEFHQFPIGPCHNNYYTAPREFPQFPIEDDGDKVEVGNGGDGGQSYKDDANVGVSDEVFPDVGMVDVAGGNVEGNDLEGDELDGSNVEFGDVEGVDVEGSNLDTEKLGEAAVEDSDLEVVHIKKTSNAEVNAPRKRARGKTCPVAKQQRLEQLQSQQVHSAGDVVLGVGSHGGPGFGAVEQSVGHAPTHAGSSFGTAMSTVGPADVPSAVAKQIVRPADVHSAAVEEGVRPADVPSRAGEKGVGPSDVPFGPVEQTVGPADVLPRAAGQSEWPIHDEMEIS